MCSGRSAPKDRHSAYSIRRARIAYRWHALFGRTLQVSYNRRGKDLTCIYTDERPGLTRELPNWMFDENYCAKMSFGAPQVSIEALNELARVLATGGKAASRGSRSRSSKPREAIRAQHKELGQKTARAESRAAEDYVASASEHERIDRSVGRPSARSAPRPEDGGCGKRGRRS